MPRPNQARIVEPESQSQASRSRLGERCDTRRGHVELQTPTRVSVLLSAWANGDLNARDQVFDRLYVELKACAARYLRREPSNHSLHATALVNEVYCRFAESDPITANDRAHFMALAGRAMRHVLVDHARSRLSEKRGKKWQRTTLNCDDLACEYAPDVLDIDRALTRLAEVDPERAKLVELRYFGGYSIEETALALNCSPATVKRSWDLARSFLHYILASEVTAATLNLGTK